MDNLTNIFSSFTNFNFYSKLHQIGGALAENQQIIMGVVLAVVLFIVSRNLYNNWKYNKDNPAFFKNGKDAKEEITILEKIFNFSEGEPQDYDVSYSFWFYLHDYKYKKKQFKHIFTDGQWNDGKSEGSFVNFWFTPYINNMRIYLNNSKRFDNWTIKDLPMKKWTNIIFITNTRSVSVYKNGRLTFTAPTSGIPKYVKGDLHVNKLGGYDGSFASIRYFPKTLSQEAIDYIYKAGPQTTNYLGRFIKKAKKKLSNTEMKIKGVFGDDIAAKYKECKIAKRKKKSWMLFSGQGCCQSNALTTFKTQNGQISKQCKELCKKDNKCVASTFISNSTGSEGICRLHKTKNGSTNLSLIKDFKTKISSSCNTNTKCYAKRFNLSRSTKRSNTKWEDAVDETTELLKRNNKLTKKDEKRNRKIAKMHTKALKKAFGKYDVNKDTVIDLGEFTEGVPSRKNVISRSKAVKGGGLKPGVLVGNSWQQITKNKSAGTVQVKKDYEVKFSIIPTAVRPGLANIIHCTQSGRNCCGAKDRIPAVWFYSNSTRLMIIPGSYAQTNLNYSPAVSLPLNKETTVAIKVSGSRLNVTLSGGISWSGGRSLSASRVSSGSAHFWISDPWYNPARAKIRNVSYKA